MTVSPTVVVATPKFWPKGDCRPGVGRLRPKRLRANGPIFYAYLLRGKAYMVKGDLDHALADYDQQIKLHPARRLWAFDQRGRAYVVKW